MKLNKNILPIITALIIFVVLSTIYFSPALQGKQVDQHDTKVWVGMSKEIKDYKAESGETTLWTNSMFGGMPTYLINSSNPSNLTKYFHSFLTLWDTLRPINFAILYFLGFYIALLLFKVNPWLSIVGALAFGFSSYFFIIIQAGHVTKVIAIGYMAPIVAGIYSAYNGKKLLGAIVMSIFLSTQLLINHLQITYYTMLLILPLVIIIFINNIKQKQTSEFLKSSLILLVGLLLVIGANFASLYTTYEYGKESLRGPSELNIDKNNQTSGLDKDYATSWSYGKLETFNLFIPNFTGGASVAELSKKSASYNKLLEVHVPKQQANDAIKQMPTYWGPQPFTSGPVYIGALVIFLFVMGIFLVKGTLRTWLLTATALSIMLAWGKNFMFFSDLFFDYFPGYNKFRTVSMILVIAEFTIPLLGILALKNIIENKVTKEQTIKALKYSVGILTGLIVIFLINPGILSFTSETDAQLPEYLKESIITDRASIFKSDAFRSLIFILIGATTIWLFIKNKIKATHLYIIIGLAIVIDLWAVNKRYLNDNNFVNKKNIEVPFTASKADEFILQDKTLDYRVLNLAVSTFNDASTSYFHKSIGGYHGAKMRRYQELIDFYITKEMQNIINTLQNNPTQQSVEQALQKNVVLNMLNTKYIIYNLEAPPISNNFAYGNAWFVENTEIANDANEEIKKMNNFNPTTTAIVDKRFSKELFKFTKDTTAKINLTSYKPNHLTYTTTNKSNQLAIFSEIYYDKGWNAYIDGKPTTHFRANYILRAMKIPSGKHTIEFKFEPKSWQIGSIISLTSSIILIISLILIIYLEFFKKKKIEKI